MFVARLRDEFLVREQGATVRGLHEMRSAIVSRLIHDITVRDIGETLAAVLAVVEVAHLGIAIRRAAALANDDVILAALRHRVINGGSALELAATLHGLRLLDYDRSAEEAAGRLSASLAPGEIAAAVHQAFGVHLHDQVVIDLSTPALVTDPVNDMRCALARSVDLDGLVDRDGILAAGVLADVLVGFDGAVDIAELARVMAVITPRLTGDLDEFVRLLDAARLHGGEVHANVVDARGGSIVAATAVAARGAFALAPGNLEESEPTFERRASSVSPYWEVGRTDGTLAPLLLAALPEAAAIRIITVDDRDCEIPPLTAVPWPPRVLAGTPALSHRGSRRESAPRCSQPWGCRSGRQGLRRRRDCCRRSRLRWMPG